jgi:ATP-dependent Clp protease ATP-binding subunit ClpX
LKQVIPQDLVHFGLIPELVGRLPVITTLMSLDRKALISILTEPKDAIFKQYVKLLQMDGVDLEFDDEALNSVADKAIERETGARGLRSIMEDILTTVMFDVPSDPTIEKITVTGDCVKNKQQPVIVHNPDKKAQRMLIPHKQPSKRRENAS